ncbi:hypothetical protein [Dictyobacter formicarum]|uniref:IPT/TIG domain-containing protein n=1 Tax=Dictyobacter formicarum TaxID=2778368 RepID=A0ABQ3VAC7_9CHLR|nr:hypothetical protein [Dictyobacter formicarum]GHO82753.1 hypothetical protein KSZ_07590 [Dictyobacter formicarum]
MKNTHHRSLWVGLIGVVIVVVVLLLFGYASRSHYSAPGATLSVGPNPASPGTTVMVTGFQYAAAKKVEVYFQNRANGVVSTVTTGGGFFNVALQLPRHYVDGLSYVYAVSDSTTTRAPLHFARPSVTYAAVKASQQTNPDLQSSVLVRGTGFLTNEPVTFEFRNEATAIQTGKLTTDGNGTFTLPLSTADTPYQGNASLTVRDTLHQPAWTIPIWLTPQIHIRPTSGPVGTRVHIRGTGFQRHEEVRISFQGIFVAWAYTNRVGKFSTAFQVPHAATLTSPTDERQASGFASLSPALQIPNGATLTPSTDDVRAVGMSSGAVATASFQVQPSVFLDPPFARPNQWVSTRGSQFSPNGTVEILFADPDTSASSVGIPVSTLTASSTGLISTSFQVPAIAVDGRRYNIVYIDEATGVSVTAPIFVM